MRLEIAGTSTGGTSYMERIANCVMESGTGSVRILVTKGPKQSFVMAKVNKCVDTLNHIIISQGGAPLTNVNVRAEQ